jgi:hypothetical protein
MVKWVGPILTGVSDATFRSVANSIRHRQASNTPPFSKGGQGPYRIISYETPSSRRIGGSQNWSFILVQTVSREAAAPLERKLHLVLDNWKMFGAVIFCPSLCFA